MTDKDPRPLSVLATLLCHTGYLDKDTVDDAMSLASALGLPFHRVLAMGQLVPMDVLEKARALESGFERGLISEIEFAQQVTALASTNLPAAPHTVAGAPPAAQDAPAHLPADEPLAPPRTVFEFLTVAEIAERTESHPYFEFCAEDTTNMVDLIVSKFSVSAEDAALALTCFSQLELGALTMPDAIFALKYCMEKCSQNILPVDAAEQLGFRSGIWAIYDTLVAR
jgi:hypothetical protein